LLSSGLGRVVAAVMDKESLNFVREEEILNKVANDGHKILPVVPKIVQVLFRTHKEKSETDAIREVKRGELPASRQPGSPESSQLGLILKAFANFAILSLLQTFFFHN
jgi:hypothetical protein